jgi:hypothetical protein
MEIGTETCVSGRCLAVTTISSSFPAETGAGAADAGLAASGADGAACAQAADVRHRLHDPISHAR